jgi:hypothetical protein
MDTRGTVPVWIHVDEEGTISFLVDITEDKFVARLLEEALAKIQYSGPVDCVGIRNAAGGAVDVTMTVKELLESGCGSGQNPLLLDLGEGMLSSYSS